MGASLLPRCLSLAPARREPKAMAPGRPRALALLAITILATASFVGCSGAKDDQSPEGAVRLLIAAARTGDRVGVYQRLGPATRARLEKLAATSRKTGARGTLEPEGFLSVGWALPAWEPHGIRTTRRESDIAEVEVQSAAGDRHTLTLVREDQAWKIELPGN